jgi:hypothetical protein
VLREALGKHAEAVKLARSLKKFGGEGRYPVNYSAGYINTPVHEALQACRKAMYMLDCDSQLRAEEGDVRGSLESCEALLAAARSIGDEPFPNAMLVRVSGAAIAVDALERSLAQAKDPASQEQLKAIQELIAREIQAPILHHAMRGERSGFDGLRSSPMTEVGKRKFKPSQLAGVGSDSWQGWFLDTFPRVMMRGWPDYLRLMNKAVAAAEAPAEEQGAAFNEVEREHRESQAIVVRVLMPAISKLGQVNRRNQANLRCTMAGLAVERYRLKHGKWPESLQVLIAEGLLPAVPVDPFDGKTLRYKLMADGAVVYSVGLDGVDDGGKVNRSRPHEPGTDLGFRLWNEESRRQPPLPPPPDLGKDGGPP